MDNANLETVLTDLVDAIRGATLGSVEYVVVEAASRALICSWNDCHEKADWIDELAELRNLEEEMKYFR